MSQELHRPVMDEERTAYQQALRGWLGEQASSATVRAWLDASDHATFADLLVRDGWAGVGLAEGLGGEGGDLVEATLTAEELGRTSAPSATWLATTTAVPALRGRAELAQAAVAGEGAAWAVDCARRPRAPSGLELHDGRLTGMVPRVLAGAEVRWVVVPVADGDGGASLHVVDAHASGVESRVRHLLDRSRAVADLRFTDAASQRLDADGAHELDGLAARVAVLVAADALGASERMLEMAVDYSRHRVQFGVPIGSFQAVKHAAATMLVGVEAARSVIQRVAAGAPAPASPEPDDAWQLEAAATKAQVTGEAARAADSALTLHGAIGYTWEHDLQLSYKRAKLDEHLFGGVGEWNRWIASRLLVV